MYRGLWHRRSAAIKVLHTRGSDGEAVSDAMEMAVLSRWAGGAPNAPFLRRRATPVYLHLRRNCACLDVPLFLLYLHSHF